MIRTARECDLDGILELLHQVNQIHADERPDLFKAGGSKYTVEDLKEKLKKKDERIYVATDDDRVFGYAFVEIRETKESSNRHPLVNFFIDDLCVEEAFRGESIGTQLFLHVQHEAAEYGADCITLHVWEFNSPARAFYEKVGMKPIYTAMEKKL